MKRPTPIRATCIVCGKPAHPTQDRTTDGHHAHYQCLRDTQTRPTTWKYNPDDNFLQTEPAENA